MILSSHSLFLALSKERWVYSKETCASLSAKWWEI